MSAHIHLKTVPTSWLEMTLQLVRVAIGPVRMGNLALGNWRHLEPSEVNALRGLVGTER